MKISRYLAVTAAEMEGFVPPDGYRLAYMACHFSPYGIGLSNIPDTLPPDSMLILNDRTPICGHSADAIARQLLDALDDLQFGCVLLDFQRPEQEETHGLCRQLVDALPCPVGVSEHYAENLNCPVFLPPLPLDQTLEAYIEPWKGREVWLDIAPEAACICVTESGSTYTPCLMPQTQEHTFEDGSLHCLYRTEVADDRVSFQLWRDAAQLARLTEAAETLGVTKSIGLRQELFP